MSAVDDNGGTFGVLRWRVDKNEEKLIKLDEWRREVDIERASMREIVSQISKDVAELSNAFNGLRKTLVMFAFTIAGSSIVFALGILAATGRLHT